MQHKQEGVNKMRNYNRQSGAVLPYFIIIVGAFLALSAIVWQTRDAARPESLGGSRAHFRKQKLSELRVADEQSLTAYAVVNADKGIYQIPIERAIETMIREWKNPQEALARMASRVDLATAVPPPPPEAPSEFE